MNPMLRTSAFALVAGLFLFCWTSLAAQEPGWTSRVLKGSEVRAASDQQPIIERPYRPLHFYGNAVRRNYYRGNPLPLPRDILITAAFLAPSPREREEELEQRLSRPSGTLPNPEETAQQRSADEPDAADPDTPDSETPERNPAESDESPGSGTQTSSTPTLAGSADVSRPKSAQPQTRRARRNRE